MFKAFIKDLFGIQDSRAGRRSFLRTIASLTVGIAAAPLLKYLPKPLTEDERKEAIIVQALSTDEGRIALARAMLEPIRGQLEYQAIGRKLLMVDELSQGAMQYCYK